MTKLLVFIGEGQCFDLQLVSKAIAVIEGVSQLRHGSFIGAVFECDYTYAGRTTIVRISNDLETVSIGGLGDEAIDFAVRLQQVLPEIPLQVIDMDYNFNLALSSFKTGAELKLAIEQE